MPRIGIKPRHLPVSETVRKAIKSSGLSAYALAMDAGVSRTVLCDFIARRRCLNLETLDKIAPHINLRVTYPVRRASRRSEPG